MTSLVVRERRGPGLLSYWLATSALASCVSSSITAAAASSFPARLPPLESSQAKPLWNAWSESGGGSSDTDGEVESSDSEGEEWLATHQTNYSQPESLEPKFEPKPSVDDQGRQEDDGTTSQPLQTLQKLQQMLDDTDYMTAAKVARQQPAAMSPAVSVAPPIDVGQPEQLWTSKDRSKYKKQQRLRRAQQEEQNRVFSTPIHPYSSDDDQSDDTDDGLGYTLPNLPVYYSDAEGESDDGGDASNVSSNRPPPPPPPVGNGATSRPNLVPPPVAGLGYTPPPNYYAQQGPVPPDAYRGQYPYVPPPPPPEGYVQQPQQPYPPPYNAYPGYYPYVPYGSYQAPPQPYAGSQYGSWRPGPSYGQAQSSYQASPWRTQSAIPQRRPSTTASVQPKVVTNVTVSSLAVPSKSAPSVSMPPQNPNHYPATAMYPGEYYPYYAMENQQSLAEATSHVNFESIQKISLMLVTVALACYAGVSPRTLPLDEYNLRFYDNLRLVTLAAIAPVIEVLSVFDARENDFNALTNTFFVAFSFGYVLTFVVEVLMTTLVRLGVFCWFEPGIFSLAPKVPLPILPWVLRDHKYRPKRITLFAADFATSCLMAPIVEEYLKLKLLQWTVELPKNFQWVTRVSAKSKRKRKVAETVVRLPGDKDVVNANKYVTQMLAVSLGIKLCDTGRRILLFTKPTNDNKSFYAICRGIFPIHELCGTMTAIALAKRDLLGVSMPLWQLLAPAVVIHGMANFRGMKPIFKWNSSTPWSEMQLSPLNVADASTLPQLLKKGFAKLSWLIILSRVLGYCIKNYYMVNRQAVKRTTTYAGKHAAFSAELATAEMLKKQK